MTSDCTITMGEVLWFGSVPNFQAVHFPSSVLCCISLQSCNYCIHCSAASGWVTYGIIKQCHCMSLVAWEQVGLSVFQVTSTCRAKVTCVIWDCHNCAAENVINLGCDVCHPVCSSWHLQGTTMLQNIRQYLPRIMATQPRKTASSNINWCYATCDVYVV
jgi:hypothetical protein